MYSIVLLRIDILVNISVSIAFYAEYDYTLKPRRMTFSYRIGATVKVV